MKAICGGMEFEGQHLKKKVARAIAAKKLLDALESKPSRVQVCERERERGSDVRKRPLCIWSAVSGNMMDEGGLARVGHSGRNM